MFAFGKKSRQTWCKCKVNMISTLHLLRFSYLHKSTNLTFIYTYLLSLQSISFAFGTKSRQTWCKSICLHHCLTNVTKPSNENICPCFIPVLLQEKICSFTLHLYYYQTNTFARVISCLLSTQIWSSLMNVHKYHVRKFTLTRYFMTVSIKNISKTCFLDYKLWCIHKTAEHLEQVHPLE